MCKACRTALPFTLLFLLLWQGHLLGACKEESFASRFFRPAYAAAPDATLHYFGHSFFQLVTSRGTKVVMDPLARAGTPRPRFRRTSSPSAESTRTTTGFPSCAAGRCSSGVSEKRSWGTSGTR